MDNIKKKLFIFLVAFLYLANFAYAQDFSLYSGEFYEPKGEKSIEFGFYNGTYDICGSDKKIIPILVVNKGAIDNGYSLDAVGATWASLNIKEFELPKKQSGVVFLSLNPDRNDEGSYSIRVRGISLAENVKMELVIDVKVEKCYSLNLELEKEYDKVCGGENKKYSGEILNEGIQKNDIELTLNGPNWISIDKNEFSIDANEKQEFELNSDLPANAKGIFDVVVSVAIKNLPSVKSEKKLAIEVVPKYDCYKAEFISDSKITNYYSNEYISLKIRGIGIKQAAYDISLEAPEWISIEPKKLGVNPQQSGSLNLHVNPGEEVAEGTYPIKINVQFEDILYSKNIDVVLKRNKSATIKSFFAFYQYYFYVALFVLAVLFVFRRKITGKIRISYKNYRTRKARLKALEKARKARQLKKQIKGLEKIEFEVKKIKKYRTKWLLFVIILIVIISILFFSIYQFDFPISKDFVRNYYAYFIAGILISIIIILLIEFYKPLFRMLKK